MTEDALFSIMNEEDEYWGMYWANMPDPQYIKVEDKEYWPIKTASVHLYLGELYCDECGHAVIGDYCCICGSKFIVDLEPCPFCESEELKVMPVVQEGDTFYCVLCKDCNAHGPIEKDAVAAKFFWNERQMYDGD